ncbi:hypothetical protein QL093DRAFT_2344753 [Fusarium oxysporum]|nr:hypothetical protein QL093DRAFT_2344753 [Fusarium oxysporum]
MAPQNGNMKTRRNGGSKLSQSSKPVMPAIPLPYVKRQAASAAARANAVPVSSTAASTTIQEPDVRSPIKVKHVNGNVTIASRTSTSTSKAEEVARTKADAHKETKNGASDPTNTQASSCNPTPKNQVDVEARSVDKVSAGVNEKPNGVSSKGDIKTLSDNHPPSKPNKGRPPSAVPPGRYQMPPSFQPAARPMGPNVNGDMRGHRAPLPNGPPMHQPHHSNGSIHFGAFHGSTSSSPAPPSGGIAPPPGMTGPDGRPYMAPGANGFPPMMPYGAEQVPASGPPDDGSVYNQFSSAPARNGVPAPEETQSPNQPGRMFGGPEYPRMMPNAGPPPHMMSTMDGAEGLIGHLVQQFGSPEFADCVLELRYADERTPPVRIPGHRVLFSRSAELANAIAKQSRPNPNVPSLPTIVLETRSKWIRSNPFYMAAHCLYGWPLLDPTAEGMKQAAADYNQLIDRFEFALSYAAAGHLLRWDPVTRRGCEVAVQLLNWQTVEKALEFALEDHRDEGSYDVFKYGDGSRAILNEIVSFIASNTSPTFKIDTSVTDPSSYARLPQTALTSNATTRKLSPPPIARGTSVHLGKGKGRLSQQISGIQFGDLSLTDGKVSPASDASGGSQQRTPFNAVLSRILLNLPFETLKALLEAATNKANGWPNAEAVYRVVKDTVAERERRRLQIVELVKTHQVTAWAVITQQLSSPEPRYVGLWSALGWREEILPFGPSESPALGRTWVPFVGPQASTQAAYP